MAEVFLAQATGPEGFSKDVVIKVVRSFLATDQQFIDMFIAEARLSSRLNHANVVQIFDFGKHEQSYFIAMEYVRGASLFDLRRRCRDEGVPFPPTLVAEIGAQVARGLQYAHSLTEKGKWLGIVHRDVTPHNVLLSFDGAVKLTDFGIAKASSSQTAPGVLKGKFAYMSPEQARGDVVDARTDIFALGVVLWEMLTGGRLFDGDSELAVLRAVQESLIAPPTRLNPDVPNELSDLVLRALARPAGDRYQAAFEFERALANFVLRAAKSVEDTSVSLFLRQLYRAELENNDERSLVVPMPVPPMSRGVVPQASSFGSGDTLSVDRSSELAHGHELLDETQQRARTESMRAQTETVPTGRADGKTDQMPALRPSQQLPARGGTDEMPALRPSQQLPSIAAGNTDVTDRSNEKRTDPEQEPLQAAPVDPPESVRLSDSMRLDAQRRVEERQQRVAHDPTVLKQRAIALELANEESTPALVGPAPREKLSMTAIIGSAAGLLVLVFGGGYVLLRSPSPEPVDAVAPIAAVVTAPVPEAKPAEVKPEPAPVAAVAPEPLEPVPEPAPLQPVALTPEPAPVVPAPVKEQPKPAAVAVRFGSVAIRAIPFAEVLVNGRKVTEVQGTGTIKLPYGRHKLVLRHPKRQESFDVVVDGRPTAEVVFSAR